MRSLLAGILYLIAFLLPPLGIGAGVATHAILTLNTPPETQPSVPPPPAAPIPHADRPVAVILAGNEGTEITELFAPYEILCASGLYNVYVVAPKQKVSYVHPGTWIVPHHSLAGFDKAFPGGPALIVVPGFVDPTDPTIVEWLRSKGTSSILSISGGARTVAAADLFKGGEATASDAAIDVLEPAYPDVEWRRKVRYVSNDRIKASGAGTAALDATLQAILEIHGHEEMERTAKALGLTRRRQHDQPAPADFAEDSTYYMNAAFHWIRREVGVMISDDVDEMHLAAALDAYSRPLTSRVRSVSDRQRIVTTRFGLWLVPEEASGKLKELDLLVLPSGDTGGEELATRRGLSRRRIPDGPPGRAYDLVLEDLCLVDNAPSARMTARLINYPAGRLDAVDGARPWPAYLLSFQVLLGLVGVGLVFGLRRLLRPGR